MAWVRIDNRLIHGQIIETWIPYVHASALVVANDELAADLLRQEIMSLATPSGVACAFVRVDQLDDTMLDAASGIRDEHAIVLFSSCADARRAYAGGYGFRRINIGNVHYGPGKRQLSPNVALSSDDETCLRFLMKNGVELDFRCVPNDPVQVRFE